MAGEHILNGVLIYIKWASNIYSSANDNIIVFMAL